MKSKSIYPSFFSTKQSFMSISETAELYRQRSKLRFNNAKLNCQAFYSIYRSWGVRKLKIPVGITRTERVNWWNKGSITSLKSQTRDPQLKVSAEGLVLRIFMSWKIHRLQSGLNSRTLDLDASTLSREHRDRTLPPLISWKFHLQYITSTNLFSNIF